MDKSNYLPIGSVIAHKYEVIDILGEDEFEILYLVRDLERKKTFFVIKELFLESFSHRENFSVVTIPEAQGVFNKRKEQIIQEIESQRKKIYNGDVKIYGYEEDNKTIYTVMEYSSNASLERYLDYFPKDTASLPELEKLLNKDKKSKKPLFFLAGLALLGTIGSMAFYFGSDYFQTTSQDISLAIEEKNGSKMVQDEVKIEQLPSPSSSNVIVASNNVSREENTTLKNRGREENLSLEEGLQSSELERVSFEENNLTNSSLVIKDSTKQAETIEKNISDTIALNSIESRIPKAKSEEKQVSVIKPIDEKKRVEKKETIKKVEHKKEREHKKAISAFLKRYMKSISKGSASSTLKYYDKHLVRYFKFKNATQGTVRKSQQWYNRHYPYRDFKIVDFKLLKHYRKNHTDYFDLKVRTKWSVKDKRGKRHNGKTKELMTIKKVKRGFEITSIYSNN